MKAVSLIFICIKKMAKKHCWACGFTSTIEWGKQAGKQRYKWKNCGILFTGTNESVTSNNEIVWFRNGA